MPLLNGLEKIKSLTEEERLKKVIEDVEKKSVFQTLTIEELANDLQETCEALFETEFYFQACEAFFQDEGIYSSNCLTFEETLPLLSHEEAFQVFDIELELEFHTYRIRLTFEWEEPQQFKQVAIAALEELSHQYQDGYIESTLTELSKLLSWDPIFSSQLRVNRVVLQSIR